MRWWIWLGLAALTWAPVVVFVACTKPSSEQCPEPLYVELCGQSCRVLECEAVAGEHRIELLECPTPGGPALLCAANDFGSECDCDLECLRAQEGC